MAVVGAPGETLAEVLVVDAKPCAARISIEADQAPLAAVLERLSQAMGFRLVAKATLTDRVSRKLSGAPEDVLKRLMQGRNLVIDTKASKECGGRETLTTVWVLPAGNDVTRSSAVPQAPAAATATDARPQQVAPRPPRPRGTRRRMSESEWQQMKLDYKAGKVQADPETGLPIPVDPPTQTEPAP